jgi:electron transfer flavoprotein alpha subunit
MRIAVCIKQVPVLSAMEFDASTRSLKREGVRTEVSAFDVRAVIKAVELKGLHGGEVVVVTMGPPQARSSLIECLSLGADRALHVCDPALAGSDTLATARALAAALRTIEADLILAGRCSVDAETGQVGPELAELLDLPQVTAAHTLEINPALRLLTAERETDGGYERLTTKLPALVTAAEDLASERFPSRSERESAATKPLVTLTLQDLRIDPEWVGVTGSPTVVAELRSVKTTRQTQIIEGASIEETCGKLAELLVSHHGLFTKWDVGAQPSMAEVYKAPIRNQPKDVWVIAEGKGPGLRRVTFELLAKGRELADALGSRLSAFVFGSDAAQRVDTLADHGADRILLAEDPQLLPGQVELLAHAIVRAIRDLTPGIVLLPATSMGRDVAPRVAARLALGLTGDCIDIGLDAEGRLLQYKPAFGGSVVAPILSRTIPEMATIRPGMLKANEPRPCRCPEVIRLKIDDMPQSRIQIVGFRGLVETTTELDDAEIVIGIGKGLGGKENIAAIRPLAEFLGASLCTTRDVTDAGWLPRQYQVGLTGRAIAPKLYLAIAIRGAFEHMVGVRRAGIVVAINNNPRSPVFKACDYGLVGDYKAVAESLHRHLARLSPH